MGSYVIYKAKVICIKPGDDPLQEVFFFFTSLKSLVVLAYYKSPSLNLASARWKNKRFFTCILSQQQ